MKFQKSKLPKRLNQSKKVGLVKWIYELLEINCKVNLDDINIINKGHYEITVLDNFITGIEDNLNNINDGSINIPPYLYNIKYRQKSAFATIMLSLL